MVDIIARDSFNLTKFTLNSKEVLKWLAQARANLDLKDPPLERALDRFGLL